jgi:hypothetical protein
MLGRYYYYLLQRRHGTEERLDTMLVSLTAFLWIGNGLRSVGYVNTSIHVVIAQ